METVATDKKEHKFPGSIQSNYDEYLQKGHKMGFTESFPVEEVLDTIEVTKKCLRFDVTFTVKYVKVSFGPSKKHMCHAVVTDHVDIADKLPLGGFGSGCCFDEAKIMEEGIIDMCKKHDLMICEKINSWPTAKAIIQPNFYLD